MIAGIAYLVLAQGKDQAKIVKPAPPVYANAATRSLVNACRKAFANLKSARFSIVTSGETKRYTYSAGRMSGAQRTVQWVYDNRRFTVSTGKGLFAGKVGPYSVNSWLTRAGISPEVVPIQLIAKKNPLDTLVAPGSRVRKIGVMTVNGAMSDLVEIKSPGLRVSIAIRRDNHLFASLLAQNVDSKNRVLFSSTRALSWSAVNAPVPASAFKLDGTQKPQALRSIH